MPLLLSLTLPWRANQNDHVVGFRRRCLYYTFLVTLRAPRSSAILLRSLLLHRLHRHIPYAHKPHPASVSIYARGLCHWTRLALPVDMDWEGEGEDGPEDILWCVFSALVSPFSVVLVALLPSFLGRSTRGLAFRLPTFQIYLYHPHLHLNSVLSFHLCLAILSIQEAPESTRTRARERLREVLGRSSLDDVRVVSALDVARVQGAAALESQRARDQFNLVPICIPRTIWRQLGGPPLSFWTPQIVLDEFVQIRCS
ncbi:hypothetical protein C8R44DRAFT_751125 [Mycena epipterygia]|nr:hypothetical protein C8R44DRAFT_751125 [Mycena epipterygia]